MQTTLNAIRHHRPCESGWATLLKHLGKTKADDAPLSITTVLNSNGLDDALWCLRAVTGHDREIRLFAVWCARRVPHLMTDPLSVNALDVAERFANGNASAAELSEARDAAGEAWEAAEVTALEAAQAAELRRVDARRACCAAPLQRGCAMSRNPYCTDPLRECRKVAALNADRKLLSDSEATLLRRVRELTAQRDELLAVTTGFRQKLTTYVSVYPGDKQLRRLLDDCDAAIASVKGAA